MSTKTKAYIIRPFNHEDQNYNISDDLSHTYLLNDQPIEIIGNHSISILSSGDDTKKLVKFISEEQLLKLFNENRIVDYNGNIRKINKI